MEGCDEKIDTRAILKKSMYKLDLFKISNIDRVGVFFCPEKDPLDETSSHSLHFLFCHFSKGLFLFISRSKLFFRHASLVHLHVHLRTITFGLGKEKFPFQLKLVSQEMLKRVKET